MDSLCRAVYFKWEHSFLFPLQLCLGSLFCSSQRRWSRRKGWPRWNPVCGVWQRISRQVTRSTIQTSQKLARVLIRFAHSCFVSLNDVCYLRGFEMHILVTLSLLNLNCNSAGLSCFTPPLLVYSYRKYSKHLYFIHLLESFLRFYCSSFNS